VKVIVLVTRKIDEHLVDENVHTVARYRPEARQLKHKTPALFKAFGHGKF